MTTGTERPEFLGPKAPPLLLFGGKGGVGKTTSACAAALRIALDNPSEAVLLISTDPAHSVRDALGEARTPGNLRVIELDAAAEHVRFMAEHGATLHEIAGRGTFLDDEDIAGFLELSLPGVDELMCFVRIAEWLESGEAKRVIVDTAPTGHALRLLGMPRVLEGWVGAIDALLEKHRFMSGLFGGSGEDPVEAFVERMANTFDDLADTLSDADRARFVPVCNAEPLSLAETGRLLKELDELGIDAPEVIINRLVPPGLGGRWAGVRAAQAGALAASGALAGRAVVGIGLFGPEPRGEALAGFFDAPIGPPGPAEAGAESVVGAVAGVSGGVRGSIPAPGPGHRIVISAGKGGVGKTTMACALACRQAESGRRVLLVSTDPAGSLGDAFGVEIGGEPVSIAPGLRAVQMDANAEFEALKEEYLDELDALLDSLASGVDLAFDREALESLLELAPTGLDEVMALVRLTEILDQGGAPGEVAELLILDTAPTGHLLRLLELPALVQEWLNAIFRVFIKYERVISLPRVNARLLRLSKGLKKLRAMLADPGASTLFAVAIPTDVCAAETGRLVAACRAMGLEPGGVVLNQMTPEGEAGDGLAAALVRRESLSADAIEASAGGVPVVRVRRGGDLRGVAALTELGRAVFGEPAAARAAA